MAGLAGGSIRLVVQSADKHDLCINMVLCGVSSRRHMTTQSTQHSVVNVLSRE